MNGDITSTVSWSERPTNERGYSFMRRERRLPLE